MGRAAHRRDARERDEEHGRDDGRAMREWDARRIAATMGARLAAGPAADGGPAGVSVDSRALRAGELFVGLRGERTDGGAHAAVALEAGAWGVLVAGEHAHATLAAHGRLLRQAAETSAPGARRPGAVLVSEQPLAALHALARAWREELGERGARVVAVTGSTGKTSTKDILAALLGVQGKRVAASPANFNTEVGLPLALLAAPRDSELLVLEMAMRGAGQIAQLTEIARPQVGVIVNVGPAHLELLGSLEAIAAAKAELIAGLEPGCCAVVPVGERLLERHLRADVRTITFGEGGEVRLAARQADGWVVVEHGGERIELRPSFAQAHHLRNLLAAVAAARALGVTPSGELNVRFTAMRGERIELAGGVSVIDDCYNANPMSMRAAIDELVQMAPRRKLAVLGEMLELGVDGPRFHRELGEYASARGVDLVVTVGPLARAIASPSGEDARDEARTGFTGESFHATDAPAAAELLAGLLREGDTVLVKGSRAVGLERVVAARRAAGESTPAVPIGATGRG
jgi:UDP-N-acetylmuramoyl-tripeptide--D-alanyl-D-alanine ligase